MTLYIKSFHIEQPTSLKQSIDSDVIAKYCNENRGQTPLLFHSEFGSALIDSTLPFLTAIRLRGVSELLDE